MSLDLARDLHRAVAPWRSDDRWSVGIQLVRAAGSIGANTAEGLGRWHRADQRRFIIDARGSAYETEHWLLLAHELDLLGAAWLDRIDNVLRALNGLLRRWPSD